MTKNTEIIPQQKLKVFISSICGQPKYDSIRAELKELIEHTDFAKVYTFESEGASTVSAGSHYVFALEDCDVCIFLIDNKDGITEGVQREIDTVKKHGIKALYYFCTENSDEETSLQKSLKGASYAKSKNVKSFSELSTRGAQDLIDDIVFVYHHYCQGRLEFVPDDDNDSTAKIPDLETIENIDYSIPKVALENIDKCSDYILNFATREKVFRTPDEKQQTSELDNWGLKFLRVLFGEKNIADFNTAMMLELLKGKQDSALHDVVKIRWEAIQSYFSGNLSACIKDLENALETVKNSNLPDWILQDILIDLRNIQWEHAEENNRFSTPAAQEELDNLEKNVVYPILDRITKSLRDDYIKGLYKKETQSPHTVSLGRNLLKYGNYLASIYIIALYNGSLTHILLLFDQIKDFVFYLSKRYEEWNYYFNLLKLAVFTGNHKEIEGVQRANSKLLCNLSSDDAEELIWFCSVQPIKHKRITSKMRAFGTVGYYLSDEAYSKHEEDFIKMVDGWFDDDKSVVRIGGEIINALSGVSYRMKRDTLAKICCKFFDNHYSRWYTDLFKLFSRRLDFSKLSQPIAEQLISNILCVFDNEQEREQVKYAPHFLSDLRNQNFELSEKLDEAVIKYLPNYYNDSYLLNTTDAPEKTYPNFIKKYIDEQNNDNRKQGENGAFFESGIKKLYAIKIILKLSEDKIDYSQLFTSMIETAVDTLLNQNTALHIKEDAIALLCCIAINYPDEFQRNKAEIQRIENNKEKALEVSNFPMLGNLDITALRISYSFLLSTLGKDIYLDLIEFLPYIKNKTATLIHVSGFIAELLAYEKNYKLSNLEETVLLFNASDWLYSSDTDVRWNSMRILFSLSSAPEHREIINRIIIDIIDSENVYIKNLILTQMPKDDRVNEETRKYVYGVCENDANYVVRMRCKEIMQGEKNE
ncbi:MAG: hypothetical protein ACI4HO_01225 [Ruminococcus sp.]